MLVINQKKKLIPSQSKQASKIPKKIIIRTLNLTSFTNRKTNIELNLLKIDQLRIHQKDITMYN